MAEIQRFLAEPDVAVEHVVAAFAAWKVGAIACPFNPTYTEREMEDALNATGAETVIVEHDLVAALRDIPDA